MTQGFVHLHVHSEYSLLDGANRLGPMVKHAAKLGQPAIALTDHGVMHGALEFYGKAKAAGIKPIVGCELYVCKDRFDRSSHGRQSPNRTYHLIALAKNFNGYQNLTKLVSKGHLEGFYYKPRVDHGLVEAHSEDLIFLSGCLGSEIPQHIMGGNLEAAYERAKWFQALRGEDFYLELQDHGLPEQHAVNEALRRMAKDLGIRLVATNDAHYTCAEDYATHDALVCIQSGKLLSDPDKLYKTDQFYLKSYEEMLERFPGEEEALAATVEIANKCELEFELGKPIMPRYPLPEPFTEDMAYLRHLTWEGARTRYQEPFTEEVKERLEYELNMIEHMGFPGYFLIVWDFIHWAREQGIEVGPGRGSAAGSIVAFCLRITDLDPLPYNLLFERFLNPERISMPDVDVDFCIARRGEVIQYVQQKYGKDKVAQIATFGTLGAKAAIKDTGRVMEFPFQATNDLCKLVPGKPGTTLTDTLEAEGSELKAKRQESSEVGKLLDLALKMEGYVRQTGIHAAGVIIARDPLDELVPLMRAGKDDTGLIATQFEQKYCEQLGLLKMDFLGLRNLTMIAKALDLIEARTGDRLDFSKLGMDDPKTYAMLCQGDAVGVFQLESGGMRRLVAQLQPNCFEDLAALLALYRPGPLESGMVDQFVNRKHGREAITYPDPELQPILKDTYGTCLTGDTIVLDAMSGKPMRLDAIRHKDHLLVHGVDEQLRPTLARVTAFFDQGVKQVWELRLANGATLKATPDHRILTPRGWVALEDLQEGDWVGTPLADHAWDQYRFTPATGFATAELKAFDELPPPRSDHQLLIAPSADLFRLEHLSRVRWVPITQLIPLGEEAVYDLSVEAIHNFVANGIHVHNCIYQEQVMQIAQKFAGYSLGQADLLRRAMGKKDAAEMQRQKAVFLEGAARREKDPKVAGDLFDNLEKFAAYGFNKSHSAAYAVITYRTAFLKANFPAEYMAALLSSVMDNQDKLQLYIHDARAMGLEVLAPCVNRSLADFAVVDGAIRFGLSAIKNVGEGAVATVLASRGDQGPFTDLYDFCERVDVKVLNKRVLESLVMAGAMDALGEPPPHRAQLLAALDEAIERAARAQRDAASGQTSLFALLGGEGAATSGAGPKPKLPTVPPLDPEEALRKERELIGAYVSGHPLDAHVELLELHTTLMPAELELPDTDPARPKDGQMITFGGLLTGLKKVMTKKGSMMARGRIEAVGGGLDVVIFPAAYEKHQQLLIEDAKLLVTGKLSLREDQPPEVLASELRPLEALPILELILPQVPSGRELAALAQLLLGQPGEVPVLLSFEGRSEQVVCGSEYRVQPGPKLYEGLRQYLGPGKWRLSGGVEPAAEGALAG